MPQKQVGLLLSKNKVSMLTYDDFNWDKFVEELRKAGLEITRNESVPCG